METRSNSGRLPDFLIIGAQRCGTSSLYSYLIQHPLIDGASEKEVHYFDWRFARGRDWYLRQFPPLTSGSPRTLTGEASPYYLFHPLAAQRCAGLIPAVKIIVMLRNPVDRAYSQYHHEVRIGWETLSFEDAIAQEPLRLEGEREKLMADPTLRSRAHQSFSYLARGRYADQLETWTELFPPSQFHFVRSESFYRDPAAEYARTLDFLGVERTELEQYAPMGGTSYRDMDAATRRRLKDYFAPHNLRLREFFRREQGDATGDFGFDPRLWD